jgi:hypothetical protein
LTDDEVKQLASILMKNYGLERLVPDISCSDDGAIKDFDAEQGGTPLSD